MNPIIVSPFIIGKDCDFGQGKQRGKISVYTSVCCLFWIMKNNPLTAAAINFCRSSTELSLVSHLKIGCQNISADVDFSRLKSNRNFFIKVLLLLRKSFHCSFVFLLHIDYSCHLEREMVFFFVSVDNGFAYYRMWTFWAFSVFQSSSAVRTIFFLVSSVQTGGDDFFPPPTHTEHVFFNGKSQGSPISSSGSFKTSQYPFA